MSSEMSPLSHLLLYRLIIDLEGNRWKIDVVKFNAYYARRIKFVRGCRPSNDQWGQ